MSLERRFTRNGRTLLYRGQPVRLAGIYPRLSHKQGIEHLPGTQYDPKMNELKQRGNNFFRHWMLPYWWYSRAGNSYSPFRRNGVWDLNKYNANYFHRLELMIQSAQRHGIVVQIMIFDGTGIEVYDDNGDGHDDRWQFNPWNRNRNAHNFILDETAPQGGAPEFFHVQWNANQKGVQERFIRKVLAHTKQYWNVFYEIMNEPNTGPRINVQHRMLWADWVTSVIWSETNGARMIFYNDFDHGRDFNYWRANKATLTSYDKVDGVIFHGDPYGIDPNRPNYHFRNEKLFQVSSDGFNPELRDRYSFNLGRTGHAFRHGMLFQAESLSLHAANGIQAGGPPTVL